MEQQMNAAEAWGGQRAELSPHSDTQAPEGTKMNGAASNVAVNQNRGLTLNRVQSAPP
jgi:hypothetical protein